MNDLEPDNNPKKSCVTDIDGNEYDTVIIGEQTWMKQNLNVCHFRNGDKIPQATSSIDWRNAGERGLPVWCYYNNDSSNETKYGKLYNWYAINDPRGLAPKGWKVSSDKDWDDLTEYLGGQYVAGTKLKSKTGWYNSGDVTNESGFTALPGGIRTNIGTFDSEGFTGYWWTSTGKRWDESWDRAMTNYNGRVYRNSGYNGNGLSIRCLKE